MPKLTHEFRDPVHTFIKVDPEERKVIDSAPYQRLRHISQLSLSYLIYPGATHKRFEHALGVMELAGRVYDVVTNPENIHETIRKQDVIPLIDQKRAYWRRAVRMAALCHDLGHLPFSHGPEHLLPKDETPEKSDEDTDKKESEEAKNKDEQDGKKKKEKRWTHERISYEYITGKMMKPLWDDMKLKAEDVAKLAIGKKETIKFDKSIAFSTWEAILSEIVTGDAFGVDRMDYLLRDSLHAGVAYGRFDHYRLIDTLRILPSGEESEAPQLGVELGGLHSAEQLLLARYFMFTQVYLHPVRRAYDQHLVQFLEKYLTGGMFSEKLEDHLALTDNEILTAMAVQASDKEAVGHKEAKRIKDRQHFRVLWHRNAADVRRNKAALDCVFKQAQEKFGVDFVLRDQYKKASQISFPVLLGDGRIGDSVNSSDVLEKIPAAVAEYVFIEVDKAEAGAEWLLKNRSKIIHGKKCECAKEKKGEGHDK